MKKKLLSIAFVAAIAATAHLMGALFTAIII